MGYKLIRMPNIFETRIPNFTFMYVLSSAQNITGYGLVLVLK